MAGRRDRIIIAVILVVALISFIAVRMMTAGGTKVVITRNGEPYGTYDLAEDKTIDVSGEKGTNRITIQDGTVRVTEASCPDQICVHTAPLSQEKGGIIVCLPHELVVELKKNQNKG